MLAQCAQCNARKARLTSGQRLISELERLQIKQQETCKNLEIFQSACHQLHDQKGELEASMVSDVPCPQ